MAATQTEVPALLKKWPEFETQAALEKYLEERDLKIKVWTADDLEIDEARLGLSGSPTQVYKVNFVVLESAESKEIDPTPQGIKAMIDELVKEYVVG